MPTAFVGAHAVQLGLGAGAITRFCSKRLKMRTTAVELNPRVVAVCRHWFRLPAAASGFEVLEMDATRFVADARRRASVDVLCVDLYDHEAASPVLDSAEFYRSCFELLGDGGVMTVNLFGRDASFETSTRRIAAAFGATPCGPCQPTKEGNTVVLAMKQVTLPGPGRACPACRKHRNSLAASGPEVAAHDAPGGRRGRPVPTAPRMKSRSDPDISKAAAAAGIRAVPRPPERSANQGTVGARATVADRATARDGAAPKDSPWRATARTSATAPSSARASTTRPASLVAIDLSLNVVSHGKLTWRTRPRLAARRQDREPPTTSSGRRAASPAATARSIRWCGSAAPT